MFCQDESPTECDLVCENGGELNDSYWSYACSIGTTGESCQIRSCDSIDSCLNNDVCDTNIVNDQFTFKCICPIDFTGVLCEEIACSNHWCLKSGIVLVKNDNICSCECSTAITGDQYVTKTFSLHDSCLNVSQCTYSIVNNSVIFDCICLAGYSGTFCQESTCDDISCMNYGVAVVESNNGECICQCPTSYYGPNCEKTYVQ